MESLFQKKLLLVAFVALFLGAAFGTCIGMLISSRNFRHRTCDGGFPHPQLPRPFGAFSYGPHLPPLRTASSSPVTPTQPTAPNTPAQPASPAPALEGESVN